MSKITEQQLKELQELVGKINNAKMELGNIELQRHDFLHQASIVQGELFEFQKTLEEEYGQVSINVSTGEYEEVSEEVDANS